MHELAQAASVSTHPEVVDVSLYSSRERCVLLFNGQVPVLLAPEMDSPYGSCEPCTPGLAAERPSLASNFPPIPGKAQEVEGRGTPAAGSLRWRPAKIQQPSLIRMQGQSKALQSLAEHGLHSSCV